MDSDPPVKGNQFAREARIGLLVVVTLIGVLAYVTVRRFADHEIVEESDLRAEAIAHFGELKYPEPMETRKFARSRVASNTNSQKNLLQPDPQSEQVNSTHKTLSADPGVSRKSPIPPERSTPRSIPGEIVIDMGEPAATDPTIPPYVGANTKQSQNNLAAADSVNSHQNLTAPSINIGQETPADQITNDQITNDQITNDQIAVVPDTNGNRPPIATPIPDPPVTIVSTNNQTPQTITVKCNDSFWEISQRTYGTGHYYKALYEYNKAKFKDLNHLPVGSKVIAPPESVLRSKYPRLIKRKSHVSQTTFDQEQPEDVDYEDDVPNPLRNENDASPSPNQSHKFDLELSPARKPPADKPATFVPKQFQTPRKLQPNKQLIPIQPVPHSLGNIESKDSGPLSSETSLSPSTAHDAVGQAGTSISGTPVTSVSRPDIALVESTVEIDVVEEHFDPTPAATPQSETEEEDPGSRQTYIVKPGDTLFDIARNELSQASRYFEILELNRDSLPSETSHLSELPVGMTLQLPE